MNEFFAKAEDFRAALRNRANSEDCCWSCRSTDPRLVGFNVHKDFTSLGVPTVKCAQEVKLCPRCAVAYMNSFNAALQQKQGRNRSREVWTLNKYLAFMLASR